MTPDIERMAREADPGFGSGLMSESICGLQAIERFAALVRAQPVTDEHVSAVVRSVQPHLSTECKAWVELTEQCRYWLEAQRALKG